MDYVGKKYSDLTNFTQRNIPKAISMMSNLNLEKKCSDIANSFTQEKIPKAISIMSNLEKNISRFLLGTDDKDLNKNNDEMPPILNLEKQPSLTNLRIHKNEYDLQKKEAKEAFDIFDTDQDGFINLEELGRVMRSIGHDLTHDELKTFLELSNLSSQGLNFDDFCTFFIAQPMDADQSLNEIGAVFNAFCTPDHDTLSISNIKDVFSYVEKEVMRFFRYAKTEKRDEINFSEFSRMILADEKK